MANKRHHDSRLFQSTKEIPFKTTKVDSKNETTAIKNIENSEESLRPLTAEEIVGRNMDLMNLIVRNIDNVRERKNIAKSCKAFNILCDSKRSYVETFKGRVKKRHWIHFLGEEPLYILSDEVLVINISHYSRRNTKKLEMSINKIKMNRYKIRILKIKNLPSGYFRFFKKLDCFENINTVYFDVLKFNYIALEIFSEWESLKPDTLIFGNALNNDLDYDYSNRAIYNNDNYTLPKSLKHIHLIGGTENFDWMANALRNFNHYELESLVLGKNFTEFSTEDTMKCIVSFVHYFKEIQFSLCRTTLSFSNKYFSQVLDNFVVTDYYNLLFNIHFNVAKCNFDVWTHPDPPTAEDNSELNYNLYENVSINERYLCVKSFKIFPTFLIERHSFGNMEILSIKEGLIRMQNLLTLEIDLDVFADPNDFLNLCRGLNQNLKNIKLHNCGFLRYENVVTLAQRCPKTENMSLTEVATNVITIKKLTYMFKNLKGLEIEYSFVYDFENTINDLIKKDKINGNHLLDWPKINFLSIYFHPPNKNAKEILNTVEKNTPRKSGKFLITQTRIKFRAVWQIIIQQDTIYISKFRDIFDCQYIF
uniref:F-box domain-containing protein n=1 Tax=Strongyloides venezuelensis TaxID=75913 RepID=A0A0K0G114_STRVS